MSYPLYNTPAFVLRASASGESSRVLSLYTRELGLVHAKAQGLRKLHSKLRFHLQELAYADVTLVRGQVWRVTSARSGQTLNTYPDKELFQLRRRLFSLLARLIKGEERHEILFDSLVRGLAYAEAHTQELAEVEILLVLTVLFHLGYVGDAVMRELAGTGQWTTEHVAKARQLRPLAIKLINASFDQMHL